MFFALIQQGYVTCDVNLQCSSDMKNILFSFPLLRQGSSWNSSICGFIFSVCCSYVIRLLQKENFSYFTFNNRSLNKSVNDTVYLFS